MEGEEPSSQFQTLNKSYKVTKLQKDLSKVSNSYKVKNILNFNKQLCQFKFYTYSLNNLW